jgi:F-type H+-transporting ATPase subunit b
MPIDWFTVGAQIINFLVLVWLLKRYLYKPILDAVDAREKRIRESLADATNRESAAAAAADDLKKQQDEFSNARALLLTQATEDARVRTEALMAEASRKADTERGNQAAALRDARSRFDDRMKSLAANEVFELSRRVLADLATTPLEGSIVEVFIRRLKGLEPGAKATLRTAFVGSTQPLVVGTREPLPDAARNALQYALNQEFSADLKLSYLVQPSVICGIEVSGNGQRLAWSVGDYLASVQAALAATA